MGALATVQTQANRLRIASIVLRLTKEQQEAVLRAAPKAIAAQRVQVADNTKQIIEELKAAGMTVNEISDPAAFRAKVTGVYDRFKPRIGAELMDKALAEVN